MNSADSVRKGYQLLMGLQQTMPSAPETLIDLINDGATLEECDPQGCTPLMLAASDKGYGAVARALIQAGANCRAADKNGWTVPMHCVMADNGEILKLAADNGADIDAVNQDNYTALMLSMKMEFSLPPMGDVQTGAQECIEALIGKKADLNVQDFFGNTAAVIAASRSKVWLVGRLLAAGADPTIPNKRGETVYTAGEMQSPWAQQELKRVIDYFTPAAAFVPKKPLAPQP